MELLLTLGSKAGTSFTNDGDGVGASDQHQYVVRMRAIFQGEPYELQGSIQYFVGAGRAAPTVSISGNDQTAYPFGSVTLTYTEDDANAIYPVRFTISETPTGATGASLNNVGTVTKVDISTDSSSGAASTVFVLGNLPGTYKVKAVLIGRYQLGENQNNMTWVNNKYPIPSTEMEFTITAIQNTGPVFNEGSSATRSIAENTDAGENIGAPLTATDPDTPILYEIDSTMYQALFDLVGIVRFSAIGCCQRVRRLHRVPRRQSSEN